MKENNFNVLYIFICLKKIFKAKNVSIKKFIKYNNSCFVFLIIKYVVKYMSVKIFYKVNKYYKELLN